MTEIRQKRAKRREARREELIKELLGRRDGREFFIDVLRLTHCAPGSMNPFKTNALVTAFACGEMNAGQQILSWVLGAAPEGYLEMLKQEAQDARSAAGAERATEDDGELGLG